MIVLRKKMIEDLQLRGLSTSTQEAYVRAVRQLAEHYHKSPDQISEEDLRQCPFCCKGIMLPFRKFAPMSGWRVQFLALIGTFAHWKFATA